MKKIVDMDKWFDDYYQAIYCVQDRVKFDPCYVHTIKEIYRWLEAQPDAEEVKHGKWVSNNIRVLKGRVYGDFYCSECGVDAFYDDVYSYGGNFYCHNCGAKMDVDEKTEHLRWDSFYYKDEK